MNVEIPTNLHNHHLREKRQLSRPSKIQMKIKQSR